MTLSAESLRPAGGVSEAVTGIGVSALMGWADEAALLALAL